MPWMANSLFKYLCAFECVSIQPYVFVQWAARKWVDLYSSVRPTHLHVYDTAIRWYVHIYYYFNRFPAAALRVLQSFFIFTAILLVFFFISNRMRQRHHFNRIENLFKFYVNRRFERIESHRIPFGIWFQQAGAWMRINDCYITLLTERGEHVNSVRSLRIHICVVHSSGLFGKCTFALSSLFRHAMPPSRNQWNSMIGVIKRVPIAPNKRVNLKHFLIDSALQSKCLL